MKDGEAWQGEVGVQVGTHVPFSDGTQRSRARGRRFQMTRLQLLQGVLLAGLFGLSACACGGDSDTAPTDAATTGDADQMDSGSIDGGSDASTDAQTDAQTSSDGGLDGDATLAEFCSSNGPLVLTPGDSGRDTCTGELAETSFRYAICSCDRLITSNNITTDSFDSANGPYDPGTAGEAGSIGVNGGATQGLWVGVSAAGQERSVDVGGSLLVGSAFGIARNTNLGNPPAGSKMDVTVARRLRSGGDVTFPWGLLVGHDADVNGDIDTDSLVVAGTLTQPAGKMATANAIINASQVGDVNVPPPCSCEADDLVDIAGLVTAYATKNDNAEAGFDPSVLDGYGDGDSVTLPCGRLYAPSLSGNGALTLTVNARTALFIAGDVNFGGDFTVNVDGGGELDIFLQGNLTSSSRLDLGNINTPSRVRLYVGGSQPIALSGGGTYAGNIYAPKAQFSVSTASTIYGSLFVNGIENSHDLTVHYDTAILRAGDGCAPPPAEFTCQSCLDCGNQACNGGTCGACTTDADCCAPLVCNGSGACVPEAPF